MGLKYSLIPLLIFTMECRVATTFDWEWGPSTLQRLGKAQALRVVHIYIYITCRYSPSHLASAPGPLRRVGRVVRHVGDFRLQLLLHCGGGFQNQRHQNVQHHQVGDHEEGDLMKTSLVNI